MRRRWQIKAGRSMKIPAGNEQGSSCCGTEFNPFAILWDGNLPGEASSFQLKSKVVAREQAVVDGLHVDSNDLGAKSLAASLNDVVCAHRDGTALEELSRSRVHDN